MEIASVHFQTQTNFHGRLRSSLPHPGQGSDPAIVRTDHAKDKNEPARSQ